MEPVAASACPNCGAEGEGTFCSACGRRITTDLPPARELFAGWWDEFAGIERRLIRTAANLFFRPGQTTLDFRGGRGAMHVYPLRTYLLMALVYFAVAAATPGDVPYIIGLVFVNGDDFAQAWLPIILAFGVPGLALIGKGLYPGVRYAEHLVFSFYLHAAVYFVNAAYVAVVALGGLFLEEGRLVLDPFINAWFLIYLWLAYRRMHGKGVRPVAATVGVAVLYAIYWAVVTIVVLIVTGEYSIAELLEENNLGGG